MANFGAIAGGGLGGAGTGFAIGGPIGAGIGGVVGGLSGLFGSNAEERKMRAQMLMRAADQRAAPYLAKANVHQEITPYAMSQDHSGDVLQGALSGFGAVQNAQKAQQDNALREAALQKMLGNNPKLAAEQIQGLSGLKIGGGGAGSTYDDALAQLLQAQGGA